MDPHYRPQRLPIAALGMLAIIGAGCIGDFPGYNVWASSAYAEPVVVVAVGGQQSMHDAAAAWQVPSGADTLYGGFIMLSDPGKVPGDLRVFSQSCDLLWSTTAESRAYDLRIGADGAVTAGNPGFRATNASELEVASTTCGVFGPQGQRSFTVESWFPGEVVLRVADDQGARDFLYPADGNGSLIYFDDAAPRRVALLDAKSCEEIESTNLPDVSATIRIYPGSSDERKPEMEVDLKPWDTGNGTHGTSAVCSGK